MSKIFQSCLWILVALQATLLSRSACAHQGAINLFVDADNRMFALETFEIPQMVEYLGIEISVDGPGFGMNFPSNGVLPDAELWVDVAHDLLYWDGNGMTGTGATLEMEAPFFDNQGVPNSSTVREYNIRESTGRQGGMFWGTYNGATFWEAHGLNFMTPLNIEAGIYGVVVQVHSQLHDSTLPFVIPFVYDPNAEWDPIQEQVGIDRLRAATTAINQTDLNQDGHLDTEDIDALVAEIAAGGTNPIFDLTKDEVVDTLDIEEWLALAGIAENYTGSSFLRGDANLDGAVDGADFILWNSAKFTGTPTWSDGDFNADGAVDGQDFIIWNDNKFLSSDILPISVPEPMSVAVLMLVIAGCLHSYRR